MTQALATKPFTFRIADDTQQALRRLQAQLQLQVGDRRVTVDDTLRVAVASASAALAAGETVVTEPPFGASPVALRLNEQPSRRLGRPPRRKQVQVNSE